jgi:two-component system NtrC family sensor kinase
MLLARIRCQFIWLLRRACVRWYNGVDVSALDPQIPRTSGPVTLRSLRVLGWASVLAPALLLIGYAWIAYAQAFRAAEIRAANISSILQEHTQRVFETVSLALDQANQRLRDLDEETIRTSRPLWEEIRKIQAAAPQIGSLFVIAADGSLPLTTREFPSPPVSFSDRDYFIAHKDRDAGFFIGRGYIGRISEAPIFNFSIRRNRPEGTFNGVIGSSGNVDYFHNFYKTLGNAADEFTVVLLRSDGEILARYPTLPFGDKFDIAVLRDALGPERQLKQATSPVDRLSRVYATAKVGGFPAVVAYSATRRSVVRSWAMSLIIPGLVTLTISAVLLMLSLFALRRAQKEQIAIQQLTKTANGLKLEIERRHKAEASLLQAQKLDAVGQLTGGIAHDFNNLLMIITGNISLARRREDISVIRRFLSVAQHAADRGAELTGQLLAFSRGQSLRPIVAGLGALLENAKSWMSRAVTEAINIDLQYDADLWPVLIDVAQLEAALLNLVVNARDAIDGRGTITLRARNVDVSGPINGLAHLVAGEYVLISVEDTGKGMSADVLAKAYEPFFTTKEVGKGTGLGLSQVHGFVQQSGGDVVIDSELGRGTTVNIYLPRSYAVPSTATFSDLSVPKTIERKAVLVVDDDDQVRELTINWLHEIGYCSLAARSAREAMAIISAGEPIDILLTDIVLPGGVDGATLANQAMELRPALKVLLTTASPELKSRFRILLKPFTKVSLANGLRDEVSSPAA